MYNRRLGEYKKHTKAENWRSEIEMKGWHRYIVALAISNTVFSWVPERESF